MKRYRSVGVRPLLPQRTLDYLARGAAEGQRNAELFDAACQFRDAGIVAEEAETQLIARATLDGLSEAESRTAIRSAFTHTRREPVGNGPLPAPASGGAVPRREPKPQRDAAPLAPVSLPSPIEDGFTKLLDASFAAEEFVAIAPAREDEAGEIVPTRGVTMTREEWKQRVIARGGIEKCFSTTLGLFLRINPMVKNGAKNEHVTSFRHALVEFDRDDGGTPIPKEQQHAAILASGLPVSAVIDSGNKSLHAWVRVDAPDATEYRRRVDIIWDWFEGRCLDRQNKNPSRLSRCFLSGAPPGVEIGSLNCPGGPYQEGNLSVVAITGAPSAAGIFDGVITAQVCLNGIPRLYRRSVRFLISGGLFLNWFHNDPARRDLQVLLRTREVRSYSFSGEQGLWLKRGDQMKLHVIFRDGPLSLGSDSASSGGGGSSGAGGSNNGGVVVVIGSNNNTPSTPQAGASGATGTSFGRNIVADGFTTLRLVVRPQTDPEEILLLDLGGEVVAETIEGNVVFAFDFTVTSDELEAAIEREGHRSAEPPASVSLACVGELTWLRESRVESSRNFPITITQDLER